MISVHKKSLKNQKGKEEWSQKFLVNMTDFGGNTVA